MHKISKKEYGELVKQIAAKLRKHGMSGSGMYDFAAAETYVEQLPDIPFYIHVDSMSGGGVKDSLKAVAKRVMQHFKDSGMADKVKDAAHKQMKEVGSKAIDKLADKVNSEAEKRGHDISHLTKRGQEAAQKALADSEGLKKVMDTAHSQLEKKVGLSGNGMAVAGSNLAQTGDGMHVSGSGHYYGSGSGFLMRPSMTPGIPQGSMHVSAANHIPSRMPAGGY